MRKFFILIFILLQLNVIAKENFLIGFSQCGKRDNWRLNMEAEMERELLFHPEFSIIIKQGIEDSELQVRQIDELVKLGIDILIVSPNEIEPVQKAIEKVYQSGIPVILIDRKIDSEHYSAYVGGDNKQVGIFAAEYLASKLNYRGQILEIQGAQTTSPAFERSSGFNEVLEKYSLLENVYKIHSFWDENVLFDSLPSAIQQFPELDAIFAFNDDIAFDAYNILNENNALNDILLVGVDGLPNADGGIEMVEKGILAASVIYPTGGKEAIQIASKILHNEAYQKVNSLPITIVDQSNVKITRLQSQNIKELQKDINKSMDMLHILNGRFRTQQLFILIMVFLLVGIVILLVMYFSVNTNLRKSNENLAKQKDEITAQNLELQRLSNELEKVTQDKLRFYTNVSHEFRTPLTLISGPVERLAKDENINAEQNKLLNIAKKNIAILLKLIEQIIDFRKYEGGVAQLKPVSANLLSHLQQWNELFSEVIKLKNIQFKLTTNVQEAFTLDFDIDKMERIYTNILSNAFKYTPEGGTINIQLNKLIKSNKELYQLMISNSGKAISETDLENIFNRFYQVGSSKGSSGIGLALVKAYTELHDGSVEARNQDGFVTFKFEFPVKHETNAQESLSLNSTEQEDSLREKEQKRAEITDEILEQDAYIIDDQFDSEAISLLIVDDNEDIRNYLKMMFKDKYGIIESRSGSEGIKKAMKYVPDIIISDVMMPGIDGFEMCEYLKKEVTTSHIPIILLTANAQEEKRLTGFESGADAYFSKPVKFDLLEVRVRKLIESRQQLKERFGTGEKKDKNLNALNKLDKDFIQLFEEIIEKYIQEQDLSVDFISSKLGLSRTQLYRKIKALTNYSPVEYLTIYRLKKAEHLMRSSEISIKEIAYQLGFTAPSYFSTSFKKYFKVSPTEFLKKNRR